GDLDPRSTHPDDVVALLSGQQVDSSARHQLTRLHRLADRLVSADPPASLLLILSALGAALDTERLCIHPVSDQTLICAASLGFSPGQIAGGSALPFRPPGGPVGMAAATPRAGGGGPPGRGGGGPSRRSGRARPGRATPTWRRASRVPGRSR